ncbi:MAG: hypothetical protein H7Y22_08295 [Gemmatimonadaceae bacterium]|nr:hypothetical protein [Gloeobacterales cyanobacterium ES-bin-141]
MSLRSLVLLALILALTPPVLAQPTPVFSVGAESDARLSNRLSERALLKNFILSFQQKPERKERLVGAVTLAITQQQRLGLISQFVRQGFLRMAGLEPDVDRYLSFLQKNNPDVDFKDPQVLQMVRTSSESLGRTMGGLLLEPSSIALFALIEPELAARGRLIALQMQLERRGSWDPAGNLRLEEQIAALKQVLADETTLNTPGSATPTPPEANGLAPTQSKERLLAMQQLLKDQGVPVPTSAEGGRILVDQLFQRVGDISEGKNLPVPIDLVRVDPSGLLGRAFSSLDARIAQLEDAQTSGK